MSFVPAGVVETSAPYLCLLSVGFIHCCSCNEGDGGVSGAMAPLMALRHVCLSFFSCLHLPVVNNLFPCDITLKYHFMLTSLEASSRNSNHPTQYFFSFKLINIVVDTGTDNRMVTSFKHTEKHLPLVLMYII